MPDQMDSRVREIVSRVIAALGGRPGEDADDPGLIALSRLARMTPGEIWTAAVEAADAGDGSDRAAVAMAVEFLTDLAQEAPRHGPPSDPPPPPPGAEREGPAEVFGPPSADQLRASEGEGGGKSSESAIERALRAIGGADSWVEAGERVGNANDWITQQLDNWLAGGGPSGRDGGGSGSDKQYISREVRDRDQQEQHELRRFRAMQDIIEARRQVIGAQTANLQQFVPGLAFTRRGDTGVRADSPIQFDPATGSPVPVEFIAPGGGVLPAGMFRNDPLTAEALGGGTVDAMATRAREGRAASVDPETGEVTFGGDTVIRAPRYAVGEENNPYGWSQERVAALQRDLILSGLLDGNQIRVGLYDANTAAAFREVLGYANVAGTHWRPALTEMVEDSEDRIAEAIRQARREFEESLPAFQPPSRAALREGIRGLFAAELGRDPSLAEMTALLDDQMQDFRAQYDQQVAAARADFERTLASGVDPGLTLPEELRRPEDAELFNSLIPEGPPAELGEQIDPAANLAEEFRRRFGGEMDLRQEQREATATQQTVSQVAGSALSRLAGRVV